MTEEREPATLGPAVAADTPLTIFSSRDLLVRQVGRGRHAVCVVTFACLLDVPDIDAPGFGEAFFRDRGIDAIHVTCSGNDWYQYEDWAVALPLLRETTRPYGRVLAYGSSMGGYAALRFGARAGAEAALALSPQYSVDARLVPFERRWRREAARIRFLHEREPIAIPRAVLVYDPRHVDRRHADLIAHAVPSVRIRLPHAGHPAGAYLAETGLLSELVLACCRGDPDPGFERRARMARRRSGQYHLTLARKLSRGHLAAKCALARRAVSVAPDEPVYHSYLAVLLDACGDHDAAETCHRHAVALGPGVPLSMARLARHLLRRGRVTEAAALALRLRSLRPDDPKARALAAVALMAIGRVPAGARLALSCRSFPGLIGDAVSLLAWQNGRNGWTLRGTRFRTARLSLHLGVPDELGSADIVPHAADAPRRGWAHRWRKRPR